MPLDIILGSQWGDEGKGRIVDLLAAEADIVARYSGGDNAGHTVTIGEEIFRLHLVPSGIIHGDVTCVIGNGVVVNPAVLLREMDALAAKGVDVGPGHLKLSKQAHLISPAHIALDGAQEKRRGQRPSARRCAASVRLTGIKRRGRGCGHSSSPNRKGWPAPSTNISPNTMSFWRCTASLSSTRQPSPPSSPVTRSAWRRIWSRARPF